MKNGIGTATRVLLTASIVTAFAFVAQVTSLCVYGPTHRFWSLYLVLMGLLFVSSWAAQWVVRKSLSVGMHFYAWTCLGCVVGMVAIDATVVHESFPLILFTLTLGVLGLSLALGYRALLSYGTVCVLTMLGAGILYGETDSALVGAVLLAASGVMASENARNVQRLDAVEAEYGELKQAVDIYTDSKLK